MENNKKQKKIFISHSSQDIDIGEKFVDALVDLGIDKNDIFFSSKYHTGVSVGKNFHDVIKERLIEANIVVFLLTPNFYNSSYCLNEMGASWIIDKNIIPILIGHVDYKDMTGFINSNYVTFKANKTDMRKLTEELKEYMTSDYSRKDLDDIFNSFIEKSKNIIDQKKLNNLYNPKDFTVIENLILSHKLTDNEILLLNHFYEKQKNEIYDYKNFDKTTKKYVGSSDYNDLKQYRERFLDFDLELAKKLLIESNIITEMRMININGVEDYGGFKMELSMFRDLMSANEDCKNYFEKIKTAHLKFEKKEKNINTFDQILKDKNIKELEILGYSFIFETYTYSFGDRWMSQNTIDQIIRWEKQNDMINKLSYNYESFLQILKYRNLLEVEQTTSYGNPRLFKLKPELCQQLIEISKRSKDIMMKVLENNKTYNNLPF